MELDLQKPFLCALNDRHFSLIILKSRRRLLKNVLAFALRTSAPAPVDCSCLKYRVRCVKSKFWHRLHTAILNPRVVLKTKLFHGSHVPKAICSHTACPPHPSQTHTVSYLLIADFMSAVLVCLFLHFFDSFSPFLFHPSSDKCAFILSCL